MSIKYLCNFVTLANNKLPRKSNSNGEPCNSYTSNITERVIEQEKFSGKLMFVHSIMFKPHKENI